MATDRLGYIYAASSGPLGKRAGRIDVFNPKGVFLTEIDLPSVISERPCRIDVDSRGRIYVASRPMIVPATKRINIKTDPYATGFRYAVLRITPRVYPPQAGMKFSRPIIFALAGEVYGVAIDPSNGHVYVASSAVLEYNQAGRRLNAADEIQRVAIRARAGTFALVLAGNSTKPISYGASNTVVREALEALPGVGKGNVKVGGGRRHGSATGYVVRFIHEQADLKIERLSCDGSALRGAGTWCRARVTRKGSEGAIGFDGRDVAVWGGTGEVFVSARGPGGGEKVGEEEWVVDIYRGKGHRLVETIHDASGDPTNPYPSIAVDQANGDIYVEDFKSHRIRQYSRARSGRYQLVGVIEDGSYLKRPQMGADIAVDGSPASPNYGYLFVTSEVDGHGHVFAFAPKGRR